MEILVTVQVEFEAPDYPGVFLTHLLQFVDLAPTFQVSQDFYCSLTDVNVRSLKITHEGLPAVRLPAPTHLGPMEPQ